MPDRDATARRSTFIRDDAPPIRLPELLGPDELTAEPEQNPELQVIV